jgi:hypothetical protein
MQHGVYSWTFDQWSTNSIAKWKNNASEYPLVVADSACRSWVQSTMKPIRSNTVSSNLSDWIVFFNTWYQKIRDSISLAIQSSGIGLGSRSHCNTNPTPKSCGPRASRFGIIQSISYPIPGLEFMGNWIKNKPNTRSWDWIAQTNPSFPINWDWIGDWSNPETQYWVYFWSDPQ